MTFLDAAVVIIALIFVIRGVLVGFVRQIASIAALVFGFIAAGGYYEQFTVYLAPYIKTPQLAFLATYTLLFLAVFAAVHLLGFLLRQVITFSLLGWFDRLLGGLFGAGKAIIINTVLFMILSSFLSTTSPTMQNSLFTPYLSATSRFLLKFVRSRDLQHYFTLKEPAIRLLPAPVESGEPAGGNAQQKP